MTDQMSAQGLEASDWWFCGADKSGGSRPPPQVKPQFPRRGCISIPSLLLLSHARETPTPVQSLVVDPKSLECPLADLREEKPAVAAFDLARHPGGGREGVGHLVSPKELVGALVSPDSFLQDREVSRRSSDPKPIELRHFAKSSIAVICNISMSHPREV